MTTPPTIAPIPPEEVIPQPSWVEQWPEKKRHTATTPFPYGYQVHPEDKLKAIPIWEMVYWIEKAFDYLDKNHSLRETAEWLGNRTGRSISHQGLNNLWKARRYKDLSNPRRKILKKRKKSLAPRTPEEKREHAIRFKKAGTKRTITAATKRLAKLTQSTQSNTELNGMGGSETPLDFNAIPQDQEVIFRPNPGPQTEFLAAPEQEVLYGGAAGGGKSYALLADPMRYFDNKNFNGLILRRTNDELRELIWKSQEIYPRAFPGAKWGEKKSQWTFPSGARLWMTYLERDEDVLRYQGQAFSYIGFDELTQHPTPFVWNYMRSRLRTTDPTLPVFMRATTNPGGPGHSWVKRMFIDPAPVGKPFPATDIDTGAELRYPVGHEKEGQALFHRRFIPAKLADNPYLSREGMYEANLLSLPEMQRRQLLEGDWTIAEGAAFPEFRTSSHVIDPYEIPPDWRRFRSCDFGYSSYTAVLWIAIDPAFDTLVVYRELYVSKLTARDLAKEILKLERGESIQYGVLDSSCWHTRGQTGPSIAEEMISEGCKWRPSDRTAGARVAGRNRLHEVLKVNDESGKPGILFFNHCRQIIADLQVIPNDPRGSDDIDPRYASDHSYDALRYGIMSRPRSKSPFDFGNRTAPTWQPADPILGY
jgi:hypothetical protein